MNAKQAKTMETTKDYTYSQLINLDMTCGGLTKKQAVNAHRTDRKWNKAYKNILVLGKKAKCRMERRLIADLAGYFDDLMGS